MRAKMLIVAAVALMGAGAGLAWSGEYVVTVKPVSHEKGFDKLNVSKAAIGSTQIILYQNTAINPDCTEVPGSTLSILRQPEHGKVVVSDEPVYVAFPPANPRSASARLRVVQREVPA